MHLHVHTTIRQSHTTPGITICMYRKRCLTNKQRNKETKEQRNKGTKHSLTIHSYGGGVAS